MIKDITLGQYYPGDSPIHKLDPRTKIISVFVFIISLFVVNDFTGFALSLAAFAAVVKLSKIPLSCLWRGLKPILFLIALTSLVNLFATPGQTLVTLWILKITKEGIYRAAFMALRLALLILGSSVLTLTTKPVTLTDGMERLLSPFEKFGLPSGEIAMMMTIALRFIPTLLDETDKIMKAQTARGADFQSGGLLHRAKSLIPILVPLFVNAFRIAGDLAMAMEARCYRGGAGRTRMTVMRFSQSDALFALSVSVYFAAVVVLRYFALF